MTRWKQQEIELLKKVVRADLRSIVHRNKPIYFLDECIFSANSYKRLEYARVNEHVTVAAK